MENEKFKIDNTSSNALHREKSVTYFSSPRGGREGVSLALALSIPLFLLLNLAVGSVAIPLDAVFSILMGADCDNEVWKNIVLHTRLPQALTAVACGSGLAVAGLMLQTVFHNPLAGPSVLGISSAASLGVAFLVLMSGSIGGELVSSFGFFGNTALTLSAVIGALSAIR